jgi:hypothetical protein
MKTFTLGCSEARKTRSKLHCIQLQISLIRMLHLELSTKLLRTATYIRGGSGQAPMRPPDYGRYFALISSIYRIMIQSASLLVSYRRQLVQKLTLDRIGHDYSYPYAASGLAAPIESLFCFAPLVVTVDFESGRSDHFKNHNLNTDRAKPNDDSMGRAFVPSSGGKPLRWCQSPASSLRPLSIIYLSIHTEMA